MLDVPPVRYGEIDGDAVVYVGLQGLAFGLEMTLDADDWEMVSAITPAWTTSGLRRLSGHVGYVTSGRKEAAPLADQPKSRVPLATLARVLTGASKCEVVRYANGDRLDLRRANLVIQDRVAFQRSHQPVA
jgi:hypothetical protein